MKQIKNKKKNEKTEHLDCKKILSKNSKTKLEKAFMKMFGVR